MNQANGIDLLTPHAVESELFESAALGKTNAKRRDLGLPDEEPDEREVPLADDVMADEGGGGIGFADEDGNEDEP